MNSKIYSYLLTVLFFLIGTHTEASYCSEVLDTYSKDSRALNISHPDEAIETVEDFFGLKYQTNETDPSLSGFDLLYGFNYKKSEGVERALEEVSVDDIVFSVSLFQHSVVWGAMPGETLKSEIRDQTLKIQLYGQNRFVDTYAPLLKEARLNSLSSINGVSDPRNTMELPTEYMSEKLALEFAERQNSNYENHRTQVSLNSDRTVLEIVTQFDSKTEDETYKITQVYTRQPSRAPGAGYPILESGRIVIKEFKTGTSPKTESKTAILKFQRQ